jgi:hypothetical protein
VLETVGIDVPAFDHNPTTGESLGLLVEGQRTNSIRNNTMVGAVAGTPGTLPTNWSLFTALTGLTSEVVGSGSENGVTYLEFKLSGTPNAAGVYDIQFEGTGVIAAASGQSWAHSAFLKTTNNTGITNVIFCISQRDNSGTNLGRLDSSTFALATTGALPTCRNTTTFTLNAAGTTFIFPFIRLNLSGAAVDFTLRIGLPQLEQGAFATSPILTSTAAVTRSADVASITGSAFSSWYRQDEGTFFTEASKQSASNGAIFEGSDGSTFSGFTLSTATWIADVGTRLDLINRTATLADGAPFFAGTVSATAIGRIAATLTSTQTVLARNGVLASNSGGSTQRMPINSMFIGARIGAAFMHNGTIRRLTFWPTRLSNASLQTLTQ